MPYAVCAKSCLPVSRASERVKAFVSVTNEWQAQRGVVVIHVCLGLGSQLSRVVDLWNLIDGEVLRVDVALQFRLKWRANLAKAIPIDTSEKIVSFELLRAIHSAKAVLGIANETIKRSASGEHLYLYMFTHLLIKSSASLLSC